LVSEWYELDVFPFADAFTLQLLQLTFVAVGSSRRRLIWPRILHRLGNLCMARSIVAIWPLQSITSGLLRRQPISSNRLQSHRNLSIWDASSITTRCPSRRCDRHEISGGTTIAGIFLGMVGVSVCDNSMSDSIPFVFSADD